MWGSWGGECGTRKNDADRVASSRRSKQSSQSKNASSKEMFLLLGCAGCLGAMAACDGGCIGAMVGIGCMWGMGGYWC